MTRKALIEIAKLEMDCWRNVPRGLVLAILFAFIHRATTGETVEETFFRKRDQQPVDYEI